MKKKSESILLKEAILELEIMQTFELKLLKDDLHAVYEYIKPVNIFKSTLKEITSAPDFKGSIINASIGLVAGLVSKKVVAGNSHNPIKHIFGTILQMVVTSFVSKNADGIKAAASSTINTVLHSTHNNHPSNDYK